MNNLARFLVIATSLVIPCGNARTQWMHVLGHDGSLVFSYAKHKDKIFVSTEDSSVCVSTDHGATWTRSSTGLVDRFARYIASDGSMLYLSGTRQEGLYRSTDDGATWTEADGGMGRRIVGSIVSQDGFVFAGTVDSGLYRSSNRGDTWQKINIEIPDLMVYRLSVSESNLFVGTFHRGIFRSVDHGASWKSMSYPISEAWTNALACQGGRAFASSDGLSPAAWGIYRTDDWGLTWNPMSIPLGLPVVNYFAFYRNAIFAATFEGFLSSTDGGDHWNQDTTGLREKAGYAVLVDTPYVLLGGYSGVNRRLMSEIVVTSVDAKPIVPTSGFSLSQNYPNPFNPSTTIHYVIPERSRVTLEVYNVVGQLVAVLQDGVQDAGGHQLQFDASRLSSGVYFYRLRAGGFVQSKTLIVLR